MRKMIKYKVDPQETFIIWNYYVKQMIDKKKHQKE